jgi:choline dehydrogenase-like flavoprotein
MNSNISADFDIVCELSALHSYDYIIVGSGLGGGALAQRLVSANKRVLIVEKGGLMFSTHCLNTSRPHWQRNSVEGPSQDNDIVYNITKQRV